MFNDLYVNGTSVTGFGLGKEVIGLQRRSMTHLLAEKYSAGPELAYPYAELRETTGFCPDLQQGNKAENLFTTRSRLHALQSI